MQFDGDGNTWVLFNHIRKKVSKYIYMARLSSVSSNARVLSKIKQMSEIVCTDGRVPEEIQERVPDCRAGN